MLIMENTNRKFNVAIHPEPERSGFLASQDKQAYSDGEIAYKLSMDEEQVRKIRTKTNNIEKMKEI